MKKSAQSANEQMSCQLGYNEAKPLNGIIAHLTRKYGRDVFAQGLVDIKSSNTFGVPQNVACLQEDSNFCSLSEPNSWISYEFKAWRVSVTSYSIRTSTGSYPKSWVVEVSNEGTDDSWEVIDRRENNYDLSGCKVTRNFAINRSGAAWDWSFHFIRLRQTGKNHSGGDCLCSSGLLLVDKASQNPGFLRETGILIMSRGLHLTFPIKLFRFALEKTRHTST